MEKKFLLYLLYITFVEIRERSYEINDNRTYWLCDLLHNIPLMLNNEDGIKEAYDRLIEKVNGIGAENWLNTRKKEFYERYPELKD